MRREKETKVTRRRLKAGYARGAYAPRGSDSRHNAQASRFGESRPEVTATGFRVAKNGWGAAERAPTPPACRSPPRQAARSPTNAASFSRIVAVATGIDDTSDGRSPASIKATRQVGSSDSREAMTAPADPPPRTMKSKVSGNFPLFFCRRDRDHRWPSGGSS